MWFYTSTNIHRSTVTPSTKNDPSEELSDYVIVKVPKRTKNSAKVKELQKKRVTKDTKRIAKIVISRDPLRHYELEEEIRGLYSSTKHNMRTRAIVTALLSIIPATDDDGKFIKKFQEKLQKIYNLAISQMYDDIARNQYF